MINSYYTGSNTSSKEWKINLSFRGLCKFLHQGRGEWNITGKKSISLLINQATVIYWVLTHFMHCLWPQLWEGGGLFSSPPPRLSPLGAGVCSHVKWKSVDSWEAWPRDYQPQLMWETPAAEYTLEILPKWSPSQVLNACVTSRTCMMLSMGARMILFLHQLKDKQEGCKQKSWKSR